MIRACILRGSYMPWSTVVASRHLCGVCFFFFFHVGIEIRLLGWCGEAFTLFNEPSPIFFLIHI